VPSDLWRDQIESARGDLWRDQIESARGDLWRDQIESARGDLMRDQIESARGDLMREQIESARGDFHAAPLAWDARCAGVWFSMGGFARLTPRCLRPLGDARCAPHTPQ